MKIIWKYIPCLPRPQRPRGSQLGQEKRCGKSFLAFFLPTLKTSPGSPRICSPLSSIRTDSNFSPILWKFLIPLITRDVKEQKDLTKLQPPPRPPLVSHHPSGGLDLREGHSNHPILTNCRTMPTGSGKQFEDQPPTTWWLPLPNVTKSR